MKLTPGRIFSSLLLLVGLVITWKSIQDWRYLIILVILCGLAIIWEQIYRKKPIARPAIVRAGGGSLKQLKKVIAQGANVNEVEENEGRTALMNGVLANKVENVSLLLSVGVDVNARDKYGRTALMEAAYWGNEEIVEKLLLAGADASIESNDGMTSLSFAKSNRNQKIIELLSSVSSSSKEKKNTL